MDNYIYFLAMFQIFWTLAMVISLLSSDCKPMSNSEILGIIFMWVFLPIAGMYRLVTGNTIKAKLLVISSVLMWSMPFIYSFVSTIDIVITFN